MEFKEAEIRIWLEKAEKLVKETLKQLDDYNKYPRKIDDYAEFEDLLYHFGYITGHRNTLEAILKLHQNEEKEENEE